MHPSTSEHTGFRQFDGSSFGELQYTEWEFDGSEPDVREFAAHHFGHVDKVTAVGHGVYDVTTDGAAEYRVYTQASPTV